MGAVCSSHAPFYRRSQLCPGKIGLCATHGKNPTSHDMAGQLHVKTLCSPPDLPPGAAPFGPARHVGHRDTTRQAAGSYT